MLKNSRNLSVFAAVAIVGLIDSQIVFAAEAAATESAIDEPIEQIVVVAHKDERSVREIAANVTVLSRAKLNDELATSINDEALITPTGKFNVYNTLNDVY